MFRHAPSITGRRLARSMTALAAVLVRTDRMISRTEGLVAVALYLGFIAASIARG